ncbi:hypothetical protein CEXT_627051 [Caerostris extrusa]|uniref:Uncharacterized protein n=1 Tax=Caerostris extrusa TaxID=172846 RepID=A0AAV4VCW9_CAEEX|nr:hypothetical protein CEXT_627051 [Caerostris extrusa]
MYFSREYFYILYTFVLLVIVIKDSRFLWHLLPCDISIFVVIGISGEESDMPAPKSDMDPIYQFYFAVISFLSAIADYVYYRLFGTPPE